MVSTIHCSCLNIRTKIAYHTLRTMCVSEILLFVHLQLDLRVGVEIALHLVFKVKNLGSHDTL